MDKANQDGGPPDKPSAEPKVSLFAAPISRWGALLARTGPRSNDDSHYNGGHRSEAQQTQRAKNYYFHKPNAEHASLLRVKSVPRSDRNSAMTTTQKCWLVKTEPDCFSIHDLAKQPKQTTSWSGVRNYQARNFLRDEMQLGDRVLVYHSSADPPAIVGTATIAREAYPDSTAWDKTDDHYDAASTQENPRWFMVDIRLEQIFKRPLPLEKLRSIAVLKNMELLRRGSRLSVQPVRKSEFDAILKLAAAT